MATSFSSIRQPSDQNYFYKAHHFDIHSATFVDDSGNVSKLAELKVDLRKTGIRHATYDELPRSRRDKFKDFEIPLDIREWFQTHHTSFSTSRFLHTTNKDVLSTTGIPIVRYFNNNETPGITLAAHILFYEIPFIKDDYIGLRRRNVSCCWVTTLAYQLMLSIPQLAIPMLDTLHLDPGIPDYSPDIQIKKLIIQPLHSVIREGLLSTDDTKLILLDCIDCSMNAPLMSYDIAYLIEELAAFKGQPLKVLVTGLPDPRVLVAFSEIHIKVSELTRSPPSAPPSPEFLAKFTMKIWLGVGIITACGTMSFIYGNPVWLYVGCFLIMFVAIPRDVPGYSSVESERPWDVHGREEEVKNFMDKRLSKDLSEVCIELISSSGGRR